MTCTIKNMGEHFSFIHKYVAHDPLLNLSPRKSALFCAAALQLQTLNIRVSANILSNHLTLGFQILVE